MGIVCELCDQEIANETYVIRPSQFNPDEYYHYLCFLTLSDEVEEIRQDDKEDIKRMIHNLGSQTDFGDWSDDKKFPSAA
ncbi:MAG: hypothetical protein ACXAE3_16005 [Candidatus Kariarchaeaceae archaeon]|jgi:hypothetical protein